MEDVTFNSWANKINNTSYKNGQYEYKLTIRSKPLWENEPIIFIDVQIKYYAGNPGIDVLLFAINDIITENPNIKNIKTDFMISRILINNEQNDLLKILNLDMEFAPQPFNDLTKKILKHKNKLLDITNLNKTINNRINKINNTLEYLTQTYETNIIKINKITFNVIPNEKITQDPAIVIIINTYYDKLKYLKLGNEMEINNDIKKELSEISPVDIKNYDRIIFNYLPN
jgi:hypothetical protein